MSRPASKLKQTFSYADYLTWPDDERWELIHGVAYDMSPAPAPQHQRILQKIFVQLDRFFTKHICELFIAPFDVRLPEGDEDDSRIETVVQPDISVICEPKKIDRRGCKGAPDLVVEILSPATAKKDAREKFALYETHGVKEYWLAHPFEQLIEVFELGKDGRYGRAEKFFESDRMPVTLFPGLELDLGLVFGVESSAEEISLDDADRRSL